MKFDNEHLKKFFRKYKEFVDVPLLKKAPKSYMGKFKMVGDLLKNVDFEKNLLFISNQDIMKEVFLTGFFVLPTLRTYNYINVVEFMDIRMGMRSLEMSECRPEDTHYENEYDILNDILCVPCNHYEVHFSKFYQSVDLLNQTIMYRYEKKIAKNKPMKHSWIYFNGTPNSLKLEFSQLYNLFANKQDNPYFEIVDLTQTSSTTYKPISNTNTKTTKTVSNKDLDPTALDI